MDPSVLRDSTLLFVDRTVPDSTVCFPSVGKSRAKIYDRYTHSDVTFADVAGVDEAEAELIEIVDFLKNPQVH